VQGTAEKAPFTEDEFLSLMRLARLGTTALFAAQRDALAAA
jgi:ribonuclease PH